MERKEGGWVQAMIIVVPLIASITLAVFMASVSMRERLGGVHITFSWQNEQVAQLKTKLQSSFDTLSDRLESLRKKLAEVIEEYK
ncbi:MAG: hypothetical protein JSW13_00245 [Candidatus Aerophobus sp.]|nr:MAG: hypothetical protein JSW13_00245 [Candidatus Aerophobus sp.]